MYPSSVGGVGGTIFTPPSTVPPLIRPKKNEVQPLAGSVLTNICLYKHIYLWLKDGREFWCWPTYLDEKLATGWKWNGVQWSYVEVNLDTVENVLCYR